MKVSTKTAKKFPILKTNILENKLPLISIHSTPETSHSCLNLWHFPMFSRMFHETWGFTLGFEVNPEKTIIPSYKFHSDYHGETGILPGFLGSSTPRLAGKMIGRPISPRSSYGTCNGGANIRLFWGRVFPYISRIHKAYIGEDSSILGTVRNVW